MMDPSNPDVPVSPDAPTMPPPAPCPSRPGGRFAETIRYATSALCIGLLFLGIVWRLVNLDYPRTFSFDEHHFVSNARNYMAHRHDWNDHPPLGKLVLVPAMKIFGDRGLGWRLSSALLGLAIVALVGLCAAKIFKDRRAGLLAAVFAAIDGFYLSYARTALIDNPLTAFIFAALALMLWGRSLGWFAGAAVCVGLAVASKWTGACVLLLTPFLLRRARRSAWHALWMVAVASLVYLAIGVFALYTTRQPISAAGILRSNWHLLQHHAGFTVWDNAASSKWYTWPLLFHPIVMHHENIGNGMVRATSSIGNILLWFATTGAILLAMAGWARGLYRRLRRHVPIHDLQWREGFVLLGMVALTLPFIVTHRQSYIFHYLGAYGLGLGMLAARLARIERRSSLAVLGFLLCATAVSMVYLPLWTGGAQSQQAFNLRLPFASWR
ncbi:MAG: phospholipid carrier-dependent glycosyltransferase [Deltaproteobacteria bacterium]|nr:phospholipid carrier-dependent glycosyltransferase [Deltaproteobacteria bacterium]